ncbi:uncharacterized protein TNCT_623571 [Trichonephila clavata]|uniref:Uncharacterized protein n=1 Tax=Trichonephila clavata TaxID=2740835 RepID=A0A8X6LCH7_TRICU|nr:uncharacterized protein TNCT_623571 [Trichonephila clavata]
MESGKSKIPRALTEELASCGSVLHLQRDEILMTLATKGESYYSCYNRIRSDPALKRQLQTLWQERLESASADIILVDTCQTYFWSNMIGFENCFRIGVYCVPFNLIDPVANWRNPQIEFPPEKWSGYPFLLTEQCPWNLDFEDQDCLKTLHFEMMTEADSIELNVYYPENFFKFIGCTTFTNDFRRFALAKPSDARAIPQKTFQTKEACVAYLEELHDQFLKGDTLCEPEGCVLYFWDARGCLLDIDLDTSALKKAIHEFLKKDTKDRKEFALHVEENRFKIQEFQTQLDEMTEKARMKARNIRQELFLNYPYLQKTIANMFRPLGEIVDEE